MSSHCSLMYIQRRWVQAFEVAVLDCSRGMWPSCLKCTVCSFMLMVCITFLEKCWYSYSYLYIRQKMFFSYPDTSFAHQSFFHLPSQKVVNSFYALRAVVHKIHWASKLKIWPCSLRGPSFLHIVSKLNLCPAGKRVVVQFNPSCDTSYAVQTVCESKLPLLFPRLFPQFHCPHQTLKRIIAENKVLVKHHYSALRPWFIEALPFEP